MANLIRIRRGIKANLPVLSVGELALCTDVNEIYIGTNGGNLEIGKASLESLALTGTPTAPTAAAGTNTTQIATTAFVQAATAAAGQFVLWINFDKALQGKAFSVTGGGMATHNGTVPAALSAGVAVPNANTTYTITCDGKARTVTTSTFFGLYYVFIDNVSNTLAENSWAGIAAIAESGRAPLYWSVGDEITFNLNGTLSGVANQPVTMQIYGFNHDDLPGGRKAGITFGMKGLMTASDLNANGGRRMEATNTAANSFIGSEMGIWLNGELFDMFPNDVRAVIKDINKKTAANTTSTAMRIDTMKIFLFSEVELCGAEFAASMGGAAEGDQYPIFTDNASRIKLQNNGTGSVYIWWQRSPMTKNAMDFCTINNNGRSINTTGNLATSANRICLGFCV